MVKSLNSLSVNKKDTRREMNGEMEWGGRKDASDNKEQEGVRE